jgi:LysM repeat protein
MAIATPPARPEVVIVAPGETLAMIARRWGTTVPAMMMANNLVRDTVSPGKRLRLPPPLRR